MKQVRLVSGCLKGRTLIKPYSQAIQIKTTPVCPSQIRMQAQGSVIQGSMMGNFINIYQQEGTRGLWKVHTYVFHIQNALFGSINQIRAQRILDGTQSSFIIQF